MVDTTVTVADPGQPETPAHLAPGTAIGRYQLVELIGEGGMGVVYRARDPYLSRDVAVKLISAPSHSSRAGLHQARLLREAQALAKLSHPNVVAAFDVGSHGDGVFIAMELIEGVPFNKWLATKRTPREIVRVLVAAGRGLAAAHAAGFMHRDFKPGNVMVSPDGRVRVVDFGLARTLGDVTPPPDDERDGSDTDRLLRPAPAVSARGSAIDVATASATTQDLATSAPPPSDRLVDPPSSPSSPSSSSNTRTSELDYVAFLSVQLSQTGAIMGTPGYMAPEQLVRDVVDARADQFAFAATAFYSLTGKAAYPGKHVATYRAAVVGHKRTPWPAGISRRVRKVIDRGLSVRVADRYTSVADMVDALERTLRPPRTLVAGVGLVLAGAATATAVAFIHPSVDACTLDEHGFDAAWSGRHRDRLTTAFRDTAHPGGVETAKLVGAQLDAIRDRWNGMLQTACTDTHVNMRQSERVLALRSACLERQRENVGVLVESMIAHATPSLVEGATSAVHNIATSFKECEDIAALIDGDDRLPKSPAERAAVIAFDRKFRHLRAQMFVSDPVVAMSAFRTLLTEAEQLGNPQSIAATRIELGKVLSRMGRGAESTAMLGEALRFATVTGSRRFTARAAAAMFSNAVFNEHYAEAEHIAPFVESMVDLARPSFEAIDVLVNSAAIAANKYDFTTAMERLSRAHQGADSIGSEASISRLRIDTEMALTLDLMDDVEGAVTKSREVVESTRKLFGDKHRSTVLAYSNLVALLSRAKKFDDAFQQMRELRTIASSFSDDLREVINLELLEGSIWQDRGDCGAAIPHYRAALERFERSVGPTNSSTIKAHIRLGRCLMELSRPAEAVPHFELWLDRRVAELASPDWQGEAGFALAEALWQTGATRRAVTVAQIARSRYLEAGDHVKDKADEIATWLSKHRP